ncbi:phosphoglycerate mutase family protein [Streptomyces decoyicus]|uniref:phosphoglycerate mutase family protein n=1 Tax=Streptomyces decoyicus TaxID=249567 RepID=UPI003C12B79D
MPTAVPGRPPVLPGHWRSEGTTDGQDAHSPVSESEARPVTTHLLRHGPTQYSTRYLLNGDPALPLGLTEEGVRMCAETRDAVHSSGVRTWLTSDFPRARQTANLLMGSSPRIPVTRFPAE